MPYAGENAKKSIKKQSFIMSGFIYIISIFCLLFVTCGTTPQSSQSVPAWVSNPEGTYPSRDWIAVVAEGRSQQQAEAQAMDSLARAFRTDVESITLASWQFNQIIDSSSGNRNIAFNESQNFSQDVQVSTNINGLIGVQIDVYRSNSGTVYVCARMNRRECSARYSAMIRENTAIIDRLLTAANAQRPQNTFNVFSRLSFAYALAQVTDNFQNILEVLDSSAANRKPSYGTANAIRARMIETASQITVGISVQTEQQADRILFTRAAGSFFTEKGFKIIEQPASNSQAVNYFLNADVRFETISQNVVSCRYIINASLTDRTGLAVFSFTEDDRKAHTNMASEARRLAVRAVDNSFKDGNFSVEFHSWLNTFFN